MPRLSPHYHVGIVVADVAAARASLAEQLGVTWGPVVRLGTAEYRSGDGRDVVVPTVLCYSVDEPHLELIEEVPGSVWVRNEHSNLHHIGFWSDDLAGDSARISGLGCPMQLVGRAGDVAPVSFSYHGHELGIRVELVDSSLRDALASLLFRPDDS
jgi:hypothetical protein